jgi:hypothetical protein
VMTSILEGVMLNFNKSILLLLLIFMSVDAGVNILSTNPCNRLF